MVVLLTAVINFMTHCQLSNLTHPIRMDYLWLCIPLHNILMFAWYSVHLTMTPYIPLFPLMDQHIAIHSDIFGLIGCDKLQPPQPYGGSLSNLVFALDQLDNYRQGFL